MDRSDGSLRGRRLRGLLHSRERRVLLRFAFGSRGFFCPDDFLERSYTRTKLRDLLSQLLKIAVVHNVTNVQGGPRNRAGKSLEEALAT